MVMETRGGQIHSSHDPHVKKGIRMAFQGAASDSRFASNEKSPHLSRSMWGTYCVCVRECLRVEFSLSERVIYCTRQESW